MAFLDIWKAVADPLVAIINKVVPDKAAAAAAVAQLQTIALQGQLNEEFAQLTSVTTAQSDINKVEAANTSVLVSGWRPAIGWVCATALAYTYLVKPLVTGAALIVGHPVPAPGLPGLDDNLWQLMFGMLGMGALRSFDKVKGVASR